ncbi:type I restriction-modification system S protein [Streptococcus pneumoniae]|uniref:restriction endonuclease subunit S n=1 Tax=Streptococcus pneumoniae TaxID=1313 RepID=UPI000B58C476|nr:restriction endonuclease subunit S [Streptococcus pneumoniae]SNJ42153.1 type I restriction-modification system S protein [Streptococcus pneumoniae]
MTPEQLKASILQRAMEGKLVPQNPNDEPASELLKRIKAEKEKLISEGKIKRDKKETEIFRGDDGKHYGKFADGSTQEIDVPYDIPDTWEWVRFSTLVEIVRGGSPRPIKDYLTSEVDGINWIKIGDTEKGEKYINNVKEKIKKSGLNKTRFVKKGTFLLTNSMSFGRPYILNVDGAIHDGWLAISNYENSLNKDYLFYILSSNVVYSQFLSLISGAVVKNLNSDKVASILIPLPPLSEQQRIIEAIESALEKVDEYAESYNRLEQLDKEFPDKLKKSILQYAMQGKLVSQNSVLFSTVRPYLKNIAVVRELKEYLIASTAFIVLDTLLNETYLKYYLLSDNFINRVNNKSTGTSYPAINDYNFNLLLIALPPLSEQQRIVEAIESALEKVDEYAESYNRLEQLDKEFPDKLKKSILQYAMQGKLVEQDPNDESVEVLLEKIRAEKQKLFEEGKIKKKDLDISIVSQGDDNSYYEEVPCEIPESWEWVRLNDITSYIQRGKSPKYSNIPIYPVIAQKCNQWSGFSIDLARFIDPETVHSYQKERLLRDGDLMWNSTGLGTLGRLAIYHENKNPYGWAVADSHVTVIRVLSGVINCHFIYNFLSSPIVQSVIEEKASGSTKQKELLTKTIKEYLIPLPPLPEQSRIVDKIEQFFAHIDALI